jgi:hypothetical protein
VSSKELGGDPYTLEWQGSWWALRGSATDGDGCDITRRRRVARAPPRGAGAGGYVRAPPRRRRPADGGAAPPAAGGGGAGGGGPPPLAAGVAGCATPSHSTVKDTTQQTARAEANDAIVSNIACRAASRRRRLSAAPRRARVTALMRDVPRAPSLALA